MNPKLAITLALLAHAVYPSATMAAPTLKPDVAVAAAVVTVGDMFSDAGALSDQPLFRAPPIGTTGVVSLAEVSAAAARLGLVGYEAGDVAEVRVSRLGTVVDEALLTTLLVDDLKRRGIVTGAMEARAIFNAPLEDITVDAVPEAVRLLSLRYAPTNNSFNARFQIAGLAKALDLKGTLEVTIAVPHLARNLPAGSVIGAEDVVMRQVPLPFADATGVLAISDVVGKELRRPSREGVMLKPDDVGEPQLIARNEAVTLYYRQGPLTLTVKGKALNSAVAGAPVSVLNALSNRVVTGIALASGAVEIRSTAPLSIAGLE